MFEQGSVEFAPTAEEVKTISNNVESEDIAKLQSKVKLNKPARQDPIKTM